MRKAYGWLTSRAIVVVGAVVATSAVLAGPLTPGNGDFEPLALTSPAYTVGLPAYVIPANLLSNGTLSSTYDTTIGALRQEGTFLSEVYRNPATGFLTFVYKDTNSANGTESVLRITLASLWITNGTLHITDNGADRTGSTHNGGTLGNPGWTNGDPRFILWDSGQQQLDLQFRNDLTGGGTGGTIIQPGDSSARIFVETDATAFTTGNAAIIDGVASNALYLGPVPEPATMLLGALALGWISINRRR